MNILTVNTPTKGRFGKLFTASRVIGNCHVVVWGLLGLSSYTASQRIPGNWNPESTGSKR
jgi:hypothetical protein